MKEFEGLMPFHSELIPTEQGAVLCLLNDESVEQVLTWLGFNDLHSTTNPHGGRSKRRFFQGNYNEKQWLVKEINATAWQIILLDH